LCSYELLLKEAPFTESSRDEAKVYVFNDILLVALNKKALGKNKTIAGVGCCGGPLANLRGLAIAGIVFACLCSNNKIGKLTAHCQSLL
jgi:hypothetical protein